jgi:hypothetical protein
MTKKTIRSDTKKNVNRRHEKYKPEFCEMLVAHMEQGFSFDSFPAKIDIARSTMYKWFDEIPEFQNARELGEAKSMQFYETLLRTKATGIAADRGRLDPKKMDTTALIFAMKCRFRKTYGEKQEVQHTGESMKIELNYAKDAD